MLLQDKISIDNTLEKRVSRTHFLVVVKFKQVNSPKVSRIMFILSKENYLNIIAKTDTYKYFFSDIVVQRTILLKGKTEQQIILAVGLH